MSQAQIVRKMRRAPTSQKRSSVCCSTLHFQVEILAFSYVAFILNDSVLQEEKTDRRRGRKRKISIKTGDDAKDEKNEQLSVEEGEQGKALETKTPRRGRLSKTTERAEKEHQREPEISEKTPGCRGRRSGAVAKEATDDNPEKNEAKVEDSTSQEATLEEAEKESPEHKDEVEKSNQSESAVSPPSPAADEREVTWMSDSHESGDTRQPGVKRKRSDETEESIEEEEAQQEVAESEREQNEDQDDKNEGFPTSQSHSEDVKEQSCSDKKPDHQDQEVAPKKPGRRGRPPKAAAAPADDSVKKESKPDERESEQHGDEEEESGNEEEGGKETATRATTRSAARLEAERNRPSKPSTRASRQSGKEETTAGTRGARAQGSAKGGRKREASPPAARTRGGQKPEEPPSKRAKR